MPLHPELFDTLNTRLNIITEDPSVPVRQGGAGVAVQHGAHIIYALLDSDNYVTLLMNNLTDYQRTGRFETLNTWTRLSIKDQLPKSARAAFKAEYALSITSLGDYVYVFWRAADGEHRALRARPEFLSDYEVATIEVTDFNGPPLGNMPAFRLPGTLPSLNGKLGIVAMGRAETGDMVLGARVLDPADFTPRSTWKAKDLSKGTLVKLGNDASLPKYSHLSAGWMDQGLLLLEGTDTPRPATSLVVHLHNVENRSPSVVSLGMDLTALFDGTYRTQAGASVGPTRIQGLEDAGKLGATFYTTPDGQLWAQYTKSDKTRTAKLRLDTKGTGKPGLHDPRWETVDPIPGQSVKADAYNTPCTVVLPLMPTRGPSPCEIPPPRDDQGNTGPSRIYDDTDMQAFVVCVLSANQNHEPLLSTYLWGQTCRIGNYIVGELLPENQSKVHLTMVADTFPVPVPASEVWGEDSPSGMVNWALATYDYLVGEEKGAELEYQVSNAFGIKMEANILFSGVGVQGESSLVTGFESLAAQSQQTFRASSLSVSTKGVPPEAVFRPDGQHLNISQEGAYFGMTPPTRIGADAYITLPRGTDRPGEVATMGVHPDLRDSSVIGRNGSFSSFCYRPGDLRSYDVAAINAQMRMLFNSLRPDDQQRLIIDGEDFRPYYRDGNYVNRLVERFGNPAFGPNGGKPYLEFTFSETTIGRSEFQSTSSFTDGASTLVDGSWYVGEGWDQTIGMSFGPKEVQFSTNLFGSTGFRMYGTSFSTRLTTTERGAATWGLRLGEYLNPLAQGEAYTVRMYLLKPSRLWAEELAVFGGVGPEIDTATSAPVRILFTVPFLSETLRARLDQLPSS